MEELSPYSILFMTSIASSSDLTSMTDRIGPNISSWAILISGCTFVKIVSLKKYPFSPFLFPPHISFAPSFLPIETYFFEPTIFTNVQPDMRIAQEEIFGPILSVIEVKSLDEAIDVMNKIEYGLSSSIYTQDINKAMAAVEQIEAGITYVNSSTIGAEVHLPFGGVKQTGHGREGGILGIDEFSEMKTVYIDYSDRLQKAQIDK